MKPSSRGVFLLCLVSFLQGMVFYAPVAALYRTLAALLFEAGFSARSTESKENQP